MSKLLADIKSPQDIKSFNVRQMEQLAQEIRTEIIEAVSNQGGHLSSSLGVVELTLALHKIFDCPFDKLVWDVGHQTYAHKMITGRLKDFATLRQYGGLSGFPNPDESPYDVFRAGHSSTSISAALGLAKARDIQKKDYQVVAVIGDGSMTGGMAFEALNHAGHTNSNIIVVLNDNEMSISPNVGALSSYLNRIRTDSHYHKVKQDIEYLLLKIPAIGQRVAKAAERVKDSMKYFLVSGMLFEELGFTYLGPVDGHNFESLSEVLEQAKKLEGPVLVHTLTTKGKGYMYAEAHPDDYHGVGPFSIEDGRSLKKASRPSYTQVFGDTLVKLGAENEKLVAITAAMTANTGLKAFSREFPERFFDVGIAEQHAVTLAAGLAAGGLQPVVTIYSTFLQRAYDQIVHDVCLQNLPVTFAIDRGGLVGEDGATHHGVFDGSYLRHIPNMVIMAPKDENELRHMMKTAISYNGPAAVRYPRGSGVGVSIDENLQILPLGKGEILRQGRQIALLAVGSMVQTALEAADILHQCGISATVANARFVKPLDKQLIESLAQKHEFLFTLEEQTVIGGFGSGVLELLAQEDAPMCPCYPIGIPDRFVEHGKTELLKQEVGLLPGQIVERIKELMARRKDLGKKTFGCVAGR